MYSGNVSLSSLYPLRIISIFNFGTVYLACAVRSGLYLCLYRASSCKLSIFLSRLIHEIEVEWFFDDITKFLICSWLSRVDADDWVPSQLLCYCVNIPKSMYKMFVSYIYINLVSAFLVFFFAVKNPVIQTHTRTYPIGGYIRNGFCLSSSHHELVKWSIWDS